MSHKELNDALEAVHRELAESDHLDTDEVEKLQATMREIRTLLDQQTARGENLSDRVTKSARRFEESHPVLTETLGRIADILQQMGI
jgi:seryl-tRNA synthetase